MTYSARFCVAPMLDWTDRHCRYFHRTLSKTALLYTEMVTTGAILHGDCDRLLGFDQHEHPLALQLGGSDPDELARSVEIAEQYGYDEYNLNCGCPSERVQKGSFGACLMLEPELVARAVEAMQSVTSKPVTVKHRIGVDEQTGLAFTERFVQTLREAGVHHFIVHTRAAWLKGLSPKENREIPPLDREVAFALKARYPDDTFVINGQIADIPTAQQLLAQGMDGVMVGRAAYHNPWILQSVDTEINRATAPCVSTREEVVDLMSAYVSQHCSEDPLAQRAVARHMMGLAQGLPGARLWRRLLSNTRYLKQEGVHAIAKAWQEAFKG